MVLYTFNGGLPIVFEEFQEPIFSIIIFTTNVTIHDHGKNGQPLRQTQSPFGCAKRLDPTFQIAIDIFSFE